MPKGGFKQFTSSLRKKGYSASSADKIAASAGRKKYGKAGMAKKAAAGRKAAAKKRKR